MDIGITKMSTKGQIVIPSDLRDNFAIGEKLIVIKDDNRLIIKKANEIKKDFADDLDFAKRTDDALNRLSKNKKESMKFDDFIDEIKKW